MLLWNAKARYALATKSTVDFVADLSPVCRKSTVAGSLDFVDSVAVDIVAKVEHVQLGRPNVERPFDFVASVYRA